MLFIQVLHIIKLNLQIENVKICKPFKINQYLGTFINYMNSLIEKICTLHPINT